MGPAGYGVAEGGLTRQFSLPRSPEAGLRAADAPVRVSRRSTLREIGVGRTRSSFVGFLGFPLRPSRPWREVHLRFTLHFVLTVILQFLDFQNLQPIVPELVLILKSPFFASKNWVHH
jgi:hypothetical protein